MKNKERKAARRYDTANRCSAFTKSVYSGFAEDKEKLKAEIVEVIGTQALTVSAVWKSKDEWILNYSNQKFSALMNAMVEEGRLKKITDKRVSYFSVNLDYEEDEVEGE